MGKFIDITGRRFGRLVVISRHGEIKTRGNRQLVWLCKCDCGKEIIVRGISLRRGLTQSCGCLQKECVGKLKFKHGLWGSPFYHAWYGMKQRCLNPNSVSFKYYGCHGITVCNEWLNFSGFKNDMFTSYMEHKKKHKTTTIERKNNDSNYCPENCRWATRKEQSRNTRHNYMISYEGETKCLVDWANILGIQRATLAARLNKHSVETAFNM